MSVNPSSSIFTLLPISSCSNYPTKGFNQYTKKELWLTYIQCLSKEKEWLDLQFVDHQLEDDHFIALLEALKELKSQYVIRNLDLSENRITGKGVLAFIEAIKAGVRIDPSPFYTGAIDFSNNRIGEKAQMALKMVFKDLKCSDWTLAFDDNEKDPSESEVQA